MQPTPSSTSSEPGRLRAINALAWLWVLDGVTTWIGLDGFGLNEGNKLFHGMTGLALLIFKLGTLPALVILLKWVNRTPGTKTTNTLHSAILHGLIGIYLAVVLTNLVAIIIAWQQL